MKSTPLTNIHIELGAKMAEFAGYNMPISYKGIVDEHKSVRTNVGVFDVSHMGEFIVKGKEAFDLIQKITSNNVSKLTPGQIQYSCIPNKKGGIVDDLLVYRLHEDKCAEGEQAYMLVVNAGNIKKDWDWIQENNDFDVILTDISDKTGLLAVQGPNAIPLLQKLTDVNLSEIKYYNFTKGVFAGLDNVLISATGYTGSGGFELYVNQNQLEELWNKIFEIGKDFDVKPIGLGARDTLRLEMGFCLYGNDINDQTSPIEAGLSWITKVKKGDFNSREIFEEQKKNGTTKKLIAFKLSGRRVPRHNYLVENEKGDKVGYVTSGTHSPTLGYPIGLAYIGNIEGEFPKIGTEGFYVSFGKKRFPMEIVKLPFVNI